MISTLNFLGRALAHGAKHPTPNSQLSTSNATPLVWRRCAWHGEVIGFRAADDAECAGAITDTICPACRERFFNEVQAA